MRTHPVVVTGMGCLCSAGSNLKQTWKNMLAGQARLRFPTKFRAEPKRRSPVFEILADEWQASALIPDQPTERTLCVEYFLVAMAEALGQASVPAHNLFGQKVGVCIGTTVGCTLNDEEFYGDFREGLEPEFGAIERFLANNPAQFISEAFDLRGPVCTINNACSSGTDAIGQAWEWIQDGLCEMVIAGGTDELSRIPYLGFSSLLNTSEQACRPFDIHRDGLNLGEGAGALIIESGSSAQKRHVDILVEIGGYGSFLDAYHITAPHPEGYGLERALHQALAHRDPGKVSFINAHGTATEPNDRIEGQTLARLFGPHVAVVSTKAYTGHTLGAAGALEAIFTAQGLLTAQIPVTLGFCEPDPKCVVIPTRSVTEVPPTYALSTSLAFGGNNSALLLVTIK